MRKAIVYVNDKRAGVLKEIDEGYSFSYDDDYIGDFVSLTMPVSKKEYKSEVLFPFFDGLIPEGYLLELISKNWKINPNDRFGLLLVACKDPIGNVSIKEV